MRLGTLLLRDAVITLGQLETALRAQVLYGGRIGTNLVELGHIDVDTLGRYLARVLDVPVATAAQFEAADPEVVELVGAERANRFTAFPLALEDGRLHVVFRDPERREVARFADDIALPVRALCAAELRVLYYLEKHYRIERRARFVRNASDDHAPGRERRRTHPPPAAVASKPVRFEPSRRRSDDARSVSLPDPSCSVEETEQRIANASERDEIAAALLDFTIGRFDAPALLIVRGRTAVGWKARTGRDLDKLALGLGAVSSFQTAVDSERVFRGPPPTVGKPVEQALWTSLGVDLEPDELLVVPLMVRGRVVNLFYVHGLGGAALDGQAVEELRQLCTLAGDAYVRLIQAAKA